MGWKDGLRFTRTSVELRQELRSNCRRVSSLLRLRDGHDVLVSKRDTEKEERAASDLRAQERKRLSDQHRGLESGIRARNPLPAVWT